MDDSLIISLFDLANVVGDNDIGNDKNAGKSTTISMAMAMQRYDAGCIA